MAVIYARQSKDREGEGAAVARQLDACRAIAKANGLTVTEEIVDNDVSASKGTRQGFIRLVGAVRQGETDTIIVWATDRLYRRLRDLVDLVELAQDHKLTILSARSGDLDLSTPAGRMLAGMLGSAARFEVEQKGVRQVAANEQRARKGNWQFSRRPYGYERLDGVVRVIEHEASVIREGYRRSLMGETGYSIISDWNARGIAAPGGKKWSITQLRNRLQNPHYAGLVVHQGEVVGRGTHEAIVSEEDWRSFVLQIKARSGRGAESTRTKYLLSGLALCGVCGSVLFARTEYRRSGGKVMIYACTENWCVSRKLEDVDRVVEAVVIARLALPDAIDLARPRADVGPLMVEANTLRSRRADLAALLADGVLDASAVREQSARLSERLEELESTIATATTSPDIATLANSSEPAQAWAQLPLLSKRSVISKLLTVTLQKQERRGTFNPEDVVIRWLTE
jgi:site-specific DNA recombinase